MAKCSEYVMQFKDGDWLVQATETLLTGLTECTYGLDFFLYLKMNYAYQKTQHSGTTT
jgi:hypothetical protein